MNRLTVLAIASFVITMLHDQVVLSRRGLSEAEKERLGRSFWPSSVLSMRLWSAIVLGFCFLPMAMMIVWAPGSFHGSPVTVLGAIGIAAIPAIRHLVWWFQAQQARVNGQD